MNCSFGKQFKALRKWGTIPDT